MQKFPNITRMDTESNKGWFVRVSYDGQVRRKYVSDSKHGGPDNAFDVAKEVRLEILKELGKPNTERRVFKKNPHNTSGIRGVRKTWKKDAPVYEVTWQSAPGKTSRTSVSIRKYGDQEALKKAVEIRKSKELEMYGQVIEEIELPY